MYFQVKLQNGLPNRKIAEPFPDRLGRCLWQKTAHLHDFQDEVYDHLSLANMWLNQQGNRGPITRGTFASFAAHKPRCRSRWSRCGMPKLYGRILLQEEHVVCWPFDLTWEYVESLKMDCTTALDQFRFFLQFADVETYFGKSWRKVSSQLKILAATKIHLKNAGDIFCVPLNSRFLSLRR